MDGLDARYRDLVRRLLREDGQRTELPKKRKIKSELREELTEQPKCEDSEVIEVESEGLSDNSDEDDDFEDVDLSGEVEPPAQTVMEPMVISITKPEPVKTKRKFNSITKEQRELRRVLHCQCLALFLVHGALRNQWCNNYKLMQTMKKTIPASASNLLYSDHLDVLKIVKSRRFLDGLKKIMDFFNQKFKVSNQGIILKNWHELHETQPRVDKNISLSRFEYLVKNNHGSRDIAAQSFVIILRSLGLKARLIFSLQTPDYTSIAEIERRKPETHELESSQNAKTLSNPILNAKQALLNNVRNKPTAVKTRPVFDFDDSDYPVFWVEVWDKYSEKWVSIDPIVMRILEVVPMRRKSKFEPPGTDTRNQLTYVIAYDSLGGVKDVTRRYSQYYNAKTIKKSIEFKSEEHALWYENLIRAANSKFRMRKNRRDVLEMKEFHDRDLAEGMPNNVSDFKNHPAYVLESQLRQNEVIYPKDLTSKCGMFRNRGKSKSSDVINVYKRSHVYLLRSARAWYMRGRVLKMGQQALKVRKPKGKTIEEIDQEDIRLYAEFQTLLFVAPLIVDGKIPRNAFGNVDCYQPHMIPEGGYLIPVTLFPLKISEKAARILEIDYARAIVAFDFTNRKSNRTPAAKEGGVLIESKYKEAALLVCGHLVEEEHQLQRDAQELQSLKVWKYFLTKLRISDRLNAEHGKIDEENREISSEESDESEFSENNYSDDESVKHPMEKLHGFNGKDMFTREFTEEVEDSDAYYENYENGGYDEGGFSRDTQTPEIEQVYEKFGGSELTREAELFKNEDSHTQGDRGLRELHLPEVNIYEDDVSSEENEDNDEPMFFNQKPESADHGYYENGGNLTNDIENPENIESEDESNDGYCEEYSNEKLKQFKVESTVNSRPSNFDIQDDDIINIGSVSPEQLPKPDDNTESEPEVILSLPGEVAEEDQEFAFNYDSDEV